MVSGETVSRNSSGTSEAQYSHRTPSEGTFSPKIVQRLRTVKMIEGEVTDDSLFMFLYKEIDVNF